VPLATKIRQKSLNAIIDAISPHGKLH
jgi:hypothetical protein